MHNAITQSMDVAQMVLYAFWIFFAGLIYWLRMEDRREGYPLEADKFNRVGAKNNILFPKPKSFKLPTGEIVYAPNYERDGREIKAERVSKIQGYPYEPTGDAMTAEVGPSAFAARRDEVELTREGHDLIVPLRLEQHFSVSAGPDPRGWDVIATDGKVAGTVKDLWVDRADVMVRYLEVELGSEKSSSEEGGEGAEAAAKETRLLPITMLRLKRALRKDGKEKNRVEVYALRAEHFAKVPALKDANRITTLEEERICAFYAGGRLYAEPKRLGPAI